MPNNIVNASELARLRQDQLNFMPVTATIKRKTETQSDMGETEEVWATVATTVCRIRSVPRMFPEVIVGSQMTSTTTYTIVMPYNTDVIEKDRIEAIGRVFHVTRIYRVSDPTAIRVTVEEHD